MMIHQSQAGCVIGRAGQKIKEIRDVSHIFFNSLSAKDLATLRLFITFAPSSLIVLNLTELWVS